MARFPRDEYSCPLMRVVIRVIYPVVGSKSADARMVVRTALDWERDIEPTDIVDDGAYFHLDIPEQPPYLYYKPCLWTDDRLVWATGENYLAIPGAPPVAIYPCFHEQAGTITERFAIADHELRVYLPAGYHENPLKRYPVLYMHDAANVFFAQEAFCGQEWRVDETMQYLDRVNVIDKVIVVAVYPHDRMSEYTAIGYEGYSRYLVETLKPHIDSHYRTLPGPDTTAIMGSSLGGVVSFYAAWRWPQVFGMAGCLSSTFGYRDDLFHRVRTEPKSSARFYLDSGFPRDNAEVTRAMARCLLNRGYRMGEDLQYFLFPHGKHSERFWADRLHIPFQFFFGKLHRRWSGP